MQVEAEGVTLGYGTNTILDQVGMTLRPGEIVGLLGPNGAGKTTLLRALAGLVPVQAGAIRYDGLPKGHYRPAEFARRLAFLAQANQVHWSMRVHQLVALGRLPYRRPFAGPSADDQAAVERAMAATDVEAVALRRTGDLSGGERMRVLIARALAVEADLLLADEPVASLDPLHQLTIMEILRQTAHRGSGVAVVLHDLSLASRFCDRLIMLARGRIVFDGPASLLGEEQIRDVYGVASLSGEHQGQRYFLPWTPIDGDEA
ncbi:hypothetical protein BA190_08730 [Labrys sp. WJW]|uniref:ABC transporter ATP-binding protein n=1 Tax=Labrys sp. WJW TaxID=1737983 RepID=UPI00082E2DE2|nr:ABC transporter ATP-binding protein [Labrys sp. WJW]OCC05486.1 hypothetical protein BA190_08730 [Labrys sp. WJW]